MSGIQNLSINWETSTVYLSINIKVPLKDLLNLLEE